MSTSTKRRRVRSSDEEDDIVIDSDPDQGDGSWEIKKITGHRRVGGKLEYHVTWKLKPGQTEDWSDSENWVPADKMDAPELLRRYKKKLSPDRLADLTRTPKSAPETKARHTRDLEDFVVADNQIDPPRTKKKDRDLNKKREKPQRHRNSPEIVDLPSSSDESDSSPAEKRTHNTGRPRQSSDDSTIVGSGNSSTSSIENFVVSDTEEGLMIPVRQKEKNRTPSPVVVSRRKKPTWKENLNLERKDDFVFNSSDSDPDVVTDDEERHEAFLEAAQKDTEKKKKEKAEKRKVERCRQKSPERRRVITSSEDSSSGGDSPPRRRRRNLSSTNNNWINVDREKMRQQAKRTKNQPSSSKHSRGMVDYRSDGIQMSHSKVNALKNQLKLRKQFTGTYKAKESLLQGDKLLWRSSPPSEDSSSSSRPHGISFDDSNMAPQEPQYSNTRSFIDPKAPLIDDIEEEVVIIEDVNEAAFLAEELGEENGGDEEGAWDEEDEDDVSIDSDGDEHGTGDHSQNHAPTDDMEEESGSEDDLEDSDSNDDMSPDAVEDPLMLPSESPFFDSYERFARECFEFKYNAIENGLKAVYIIQFFEEPAENENEEGEDWSMVIFENTPGATPKYVCEGVRTEQMLDIDEDLVIECELRLESKEAFPVNVASNMWEAGAENEEGALH